MAASLFYTGPALQELHEGYAKQHKMDEQAPIRATHEVLIDAPVERVWGVLADPDGWHRVDRAIHDVQLGRPPAVDASFTWRNGKARIKSRFAVVAPNVELSWTGTSFGAKAIHRHVLARVDANETRLYTEESMSGLGLSLFFSTPKLRSTLESWLAALKEAAERGDDDAPA